MAVSVKELRERFEKKSTTIGHKPLTPYEFLQQQQKASNDIARNIIEARQKASTYNMTVRAMQLKNFTAVASSSAAAGVVAGTGGRKESTAPSNNSIDSAKFESNETRNGQQQQVQNKAIDDLKKSDLRMKARKYSLSLQQSLEVQSAAAVEELEKKERRASKAILQNVISQDLISELQNEGKDGDFTQALDEELKRQVEESTKAREAAELEASKAKSEAEKAKEKATEAEEHAKLAESQANQMWEEVEVKNDRMILESYLRENYPHKIGEVDQLMQEYKGHLDVLFEELARVKVEQVEKRQSIAIKKQSLAASSASTTTTAVEELLSQQDEIANSQEGNDSIQNTSSISDQADTQAEQKREGSSSIAEIPISLDEVVTQFYTVFAPQKVPEVPEVLRHFKSREGDMIRMLEIKYDVTFLDDGSCIPNEAEEIGEPFLNRDNEKRRTLRQRISSMSR